MPEPATNPPSPPIEVGDGFELTIDRVATGGSVIGNGPDGRIVFVPGALPGERVAVRTVAVHRNRLEATVEEVLEASPDRVDPVCRHVADGCGGCDWQHIAADRQPALRREIVLDCLRRLSGLGPALDEVEVVNGPALPPERYRTTVRAAVVDGRAAYRLRSSHETVVIDECPTAHPFVEELLVDGRFGAASEVVVRVGANTGERLVVVDPVVGDGVSLPEGVKAVGADEVAAGSRAHYHEELGGVRLQISAGAFFQCRADGALLLAELAGDAVAAGEGPLLDAYCGVGLFGALAGIGRSVVGVESHPWAAADATWNLRPHGRVVNERFERWEPEAVGVAILDPSRSGLRAGGCDKLAATGAAVAALVSCDPASLARDAGLLNELGYRLDRVTVVDLFGHTSHVETVSRFLRRA